jgi:hypothetical protein
MDNLRNVRETTIGTVSPGHPAPHAQGIIVLGSPPVATHSTITARSGRSGETTPRARRPRSLHPDEVLIHRETCISSRVDQWPPAGCQGLLGAASGGRGPPSVRGSLWLVEPLRTRRRMTFATVNLEQQSSLKTSSSRFLRCLNRSRRIRACCRRASRRLCNSARERCHAPRYSSGSASPSFSMDALSERNSLQVQGSKDYEPLAKAPESNREYDEDIAATMPPVGPSRNSAALLSIWRETPLAADSLSSSSRIAQGLSPSASVVGVEPAAVPVVRPERLALGPERASSVACQSLSGVTSRGDAGRYSSQPSVAGLRPKIRRFIRRLMRRAA